MIKIPKSLLMISLVFALMIPTNLFSYDCACGTCSGAVLEMAYWCTPIPLPIGDPPRTGIGCCDTGPTFIDVYFIATNGDCSLWYDLIDFDAFYISPSDLPCCLGFA